MTTESHCHICNHRAAGKALANHIRSSHGLSSEAYTVEQLFGGNRPTCPLCNGITRYVAFGFKKFCKAHIREAEAEAGKRGGKAPAWNRGKTANEDNRIRCPTGDKNPFWGKSHSEETKLKISATKLLSSLDVTLRAKHRDKEFELLTPLEQYSSRQQQYLEFKCRTCDHINRKTLQAFERGSLCECCHPVGQSQAELEVADWLRSLGVELTMNDRKLVSPKELDIVVPDKRVAIEFNGLYWHSELSPNGAQPNSHLEKTRMCENAGWTLLHIFSDDWRSRNAIIKSMVRHRLGLTLHRVSARDCELKSLDCPVRRNFFESSHVSGDVPASVSWGLFHRGCIVAALSLRPPRQKKWNGYLEVARYATLLDHHVAGGLSKLMTEAKCHASVAGKGLLSYADRCFGQGKGYESAGFRHTGNTGVDYWYTDGEVRFDRFTCRARGGATERQVAAERGLGKVYGCGSNIWLMDLLTAG